MTAYSDDSEFDALASHVRAMPKRTDAELANILDGARSDPGGAAQHSLVENFFPLALDAALQRKGRGVEVSALYQEAVVAVITSMSAHVTTAATIVDLQVSVAQDIARHLDATIEEEDRVRKAHEVVLHDVQLLSAVRTRLRAENKGDDPTIKQVAKMLKWPEERVEPLWQMLLTAESQHDQELLQYLDDE